VTRGLTNEQEVAELFRSRGWSVLDAAQLSLAQQIRLFAGAEAVCTLHGAALTNLVWCRPGVRVLELCSSTYLNGIYEGIAQIVGADYRFRVCPGEPDFRAKADLGSLTQDLDQWLNR
jgi:capsular polysaccharide biosynthesis protein